MSFGLAACGGGNAANSNQGTPATTARRTAAAPTRATGNSAQPTQDVLDDSADNGGQEPGNGALPTLDALDDSSNANGGPSSPQTQDGKVVLAGTSWTVEAGDQLYQFCDSTRWELLQDGETIAKRGTYQVAGDTLTLTNSADNQASTYQMTWKPDEEVLDLKQGSSTLRLEYDGDADCE
jgi:hypothetical protein